MVAGERYGQTISTESFELLGADLAVTQIIVPTTRGTQAETAPDGRKRPRERPKGRAGLANIMEKRGLVEVLMATNAFPDVECVSLVLGPLCKERLCDWRIEHRRDR